MGRAGLGGRSRGPERRARGGSGRRPRSAAGVGSAESQPAADVSLRPSEPDEPEDEDWYDTTVLETIEGIGADDPDDDDLQVMSTADDIDDEVIGSEVVGESDEPVPGQAGPFVVGATGEDDGAADDDGEYAEATMVGDDDDLDTETAPIATIDELMGGVESPEDAEHPTGVARPVRAGRRSRRTGGGRGGRRGSRLGRRLLDVPGGGGRVDR